QGHLDRRSDADRPGLAVPVPGPTGVGQDVHVPGGADLLGRLDRQLGGRGSIGRSRADDRGGKLARRRRGVGADDRRPRGRCARAARRRVRADQRLQGADAGVSARRGIVLALAMAAAWLALPSAASAHAYLVRTVPAASVVLDASPSTIQLTYDEAVGPRLAIISVTDADG